MITSTALREKLSGYPESLLDRYDAYLANREPEDLHFFVIGLIRFLQDAGAESAPPPADGDRLREDLGVDSITIAEVIFLLEEILEIEISNQELMDISTAGELRQFILGKVC